MTSDWYRQWFTGLEAKLEVVIVSVEGEVGSRPCAERRQRLSELCMSPNGLAW